MIAQAIFIENFIWLFSMYLLVELFVGMDQSVMHTYIAAEQKVGVAHWTFIR